MSLPRRTIHVRVTPDSDKRLSALHGKYRGLSVSYLVRVLLAHQLSRSETELTQIVEKAIRNGSNIAE